MSDSREMEEEYLPQSAGEIDSLLRLPLPGGDRPILPLNEAVLLLSSAGRIVRISTLHAGDRLGRFDFREGLSVHEVLHPGCADPDCEFVDKWDDAWDAQRNGLPVEWLTVCPLAGAMLALKMRLQPVSYACGVLFEDAGKFHGNSRVLFVQDLTGPSGRDRANGGCKKTRANRATVYELRRSTDPDPDVVASLDERLRAVTGLLLAARGSERHRIATELHDGLGQTLSLMQFELEGCIERGEEGSDAPACDCVGRAHVHAQQALRELREITRGLNVAAIGELGLGAALETSCDSFRAANPTIELSVAVEVSGGATDVPYDLAVAVYRIAQEALHNIASHSRATRASLVFSMDDSGARLVVRDNGVGLPAGRSRKRGLGLVTMRERAAAVRGDYVLSSEPGKGCSVSVSWTPRSLALLR